MLLGLSSCVKTHDPIEQLMNILNGQPFIILPWATFGNVLKRRKGALLLCYGASLSSTATTSISIQALRHEMDFL